MLPTANSVLIHLLSSLAPADPPCLSGIQDVSEELLSQPGVGITVARAPSSRCELLRQLRYLVFSIVLNFAITLALYPAGLCCLIIPFRLLLLRCGFIDVA